MKKQNRNKNLRACRRERCNYPLISESDFFVYSTKKIREIDHIVFPPSMNSDDMNAWRENFL